MDPGVFGYGEDGRRTLSITLFTACRTGSKLPINLFLDLPSENHRLRCFWSSPWSAVAERLSAGTFSLRARLLDRGASVSIFPGPLSDFSASARALKDSTRSRFRDGFEDWCGWFIDEFLHRESANASQPGWLRLISRADLVVVANCSMYYFVSRSVESYRLEHRHIGWEFQRSRTYVSVASERVFLLFPHTTYDDDHKIVDISYIRANLSRNRAPVGCPA